MLAEIRDPLYTTAWFGLMTAVWFGWAQEAPPVHLVTALTVGLVLGILLALSFGVLTARHWSWPGALKGHESRFGIVVGVEFLLAGVGATALTMAGHGRWVAWWVAWWVALVVAVHFISLAWIFRGRSFVLLGGLEVVTLAVGALLDSSGTAPTSRWVGPVMVLTILRYALANGVVTVRRLTRAREPQRHRCRGRLPPARPGAPAVSRRRSAPGSAPCPGARCRRPGSVPR